MRSFCYPINCLTFLFVTQIFIALPSVHCDDGMSKLELLKLLLEVGSLPSKFIQKVREKPILQLLGLANDIVEPFVTAAEVLLLLDELKKKLTKDDDKIIMPMPMDVQTQEQLMMIPNKPKLEVNYLMNGLESQKAIALNEPEEDIYSSHLKLKDMPYNSYDSLTPSESIASLSRPNSSPIMLSSRNRHRLTAKEEDQYFGPMNRFLAENPEFEFHYVRDMPKKYRPHHRNSIRKVKRRKPTKYRKH